VGGVGVAGIGAGVVLRVLAEAKHDDAVAEVVAADSKALQSDGETLATWANVAFIGGAALVTAGVAWLMIDVVADRPGPRAPIAVAVRPSGVSLEGGF